MQEKTLKQMKRDIMLRVYYTYAISVVFHMAFVHGLALAFSAGLLARAVSVGSILHNLAATPVGYVPTYIFNAFSGTEAFVLALIGIIVFIMLSFGITLKASREPRWQAV